MSEIIDTLVHVAPWKSLQEFTRIFFKWEAPIERPHTIPIYDISRLGLKLEGLDQMYEVIDQALKTIVQLLIHFFGMKSL